MNHILSTHIIPVMKRHYFLFIFGFVVVTVLLLAVYAFINLAHWLSPVEPLPRQADVLFTFGGDPRRTVYTLELGQLYPQAKIVLSGINKKYYLRKFQKLDIDTIRLTFTDTCKTTLEEIGFLKEYLIRAIEFSESSPLASLKTEGLRQLSVVLVSSPLHMRRIKIMVNSELLPYLQSKFKGKKVKINYAAVPLERYNLTAAAITQWWKYPNLRTYVRDEVVKTTAFLFASRFYKNYKKTKR